MLDSAPDLEPYDYVLLDEYWKLREMEGVADVPVSLQTMLGYFSLNREDRLRVELLRRVDLEYLKFRAENPPEKRQAKKKPRAAGKPSSIGKAR